VEVEMEIVSLEEEQEEKKSEGGEVVSLPEGGVVEQEIPLVILGEEEEEEVMEEEEEVMEEEEEEVLEGGEVVLVPKGGVAEEDMVEVIRESGLNLSDDMRKKRKTCESLIREFEGRGSTFQAPRDMLDLGLWACLSRPVTLKWSSFSLSCCGMLLEILGERCGQSKEEMKAQCRPHLRELSRAVRNILPDSKYNESAQPLMRWDLERFQNFFSGTPPTSKNGQVLAIMELGHLTGRRVRTLLDLIWEDVNLKEEKVCVVLNSGFKNTSTTFSDFTFPPKDAPMLTKFLTLGKDQCRSGSVFEISSVTNFINTISIMGMDVGYPKQFFSGHSLRLGFVNTRIVDGLMSGASHHDTLTRICVVGGWKPTQHSAVNSYVSSTTVGMIALVEANPGNISVIEGLQREKMNVEGWHGIILRNETTKGTKLAARLGLWEQFREVPHFNAKARNGVSLLKQIMLLRSDLYLCLEEAATDDLLWSSSGKKRDRMVRLVYLLVIPGKISAQNGELKCETTPQELRQLLAASVLGADIKPMAKKPVVLVHGDDQRSTKRLQLAKDSYARRRKPVRTLTTRA